MNEKTSRRYGSEPVVLTIRVIVVLICCSAIFLPGCGHRVLGQDTWIAVFTSLPSEVSFENIEEGAVPYIFRQTHEPLFRLEDGQNFTSKILTEWSRNLSYTEYRFCPNENLRFNEENSFSAEFLLHFLTEVTGRYRPNSHVYRENKCCVVKFPSSQPAYFNFLTKHLNAPSVKSGGVECGLGAFSLKTISKTAIELVRKKTVIDGYNRIVIYPYAGQNDPNLENRQISDFNNISSFQRPDWIKSEYRAFDNVELRVVGVAINHPDPRVRRVLYNCLDAGEFRQAAIPARKDFYDIQTLLPVGVPGAKGGRPQQQCVPDKKIAGIRVIFANPRSDNQAQLAVFAERFRQRTGMIMEIKQYRPEEMNPMLFNTAKRRPYNLAIVVTASDAPEPDGFFAFYAGKNRVVDNVPKSILDSFDRLQKENDSDRKVELAKALASDIADQVFVLPLYQTMAKLYYPGKIKNLEVGKGFVEIPDVADFE